MTNNFSFSHKVFYPSGELFAIFIKFKIVVCKLLQFGRMLNLLSGKRLSDIKFVICECFQFSRGQSFVLWERVKTGNKAFNPISKTSQTSYMSRFFENSQLIKHSVPAQSIPLHFCHTKKSTL